MNVTNKLKNKRKGMNIAPMVDMMFLLLIFFMYSSVIVQREKKMTVQVPKANAVDKKTSRVSGELIVNIDKNDKITIGQGSVESLEELKALLTRIYDANSGQHIIIRADADVKYKRVVAVMDICRQVKITNISLAVVPQAGKSE